MTELDLLVEMILKHPDIKTGDFTVTIPKKLIQLAATELAQIRAEQKLHPEKEATERLENMVRHFDHVSGRQALNEIGDIVGWDIVMEHVREELARGNEKK